MKTPKKTIAKTRKREASAAGRMGQFLLISKTITGESRIAKNAETTNGKRTTCAALSNPITIMVAIMMSETVVGERRRGVVSMGVI